MKIISSILFCFVSIVSNAQERSVQILPSLLHPINAASENLIDTTNMYNSRYGPVARLTQDNMPCIMPYTTAVPIPNAAKLGATQHEIPNFWKSEPWKYHNQLMKSKPISQGWYQPKDFKAPWIGKKDMPTAKQFPSIKNSTSFYSKREN